MIAQNNKHNTESLYRISTFLLLGTYIRIEMFKGKGKGPV